MSAAPATALLPLILRTSLLADMAVCHSHCADFLWVFVGFFFLNKAPLSRYCQNPIHIAVLLCCELFARHLFTETSFRWGKMLALCSL